MIGQLPRSLAPLPDESLHEFRSLRAPFMRRSTVASLEKWSVARRRSVPAMGFSATEFHVFEYAAS
jgi:hypothetical protein